MNSSCFAAVLVAVLAARPLAAAEAGLDPALALAATRAAAQLPAGGFVVAESRHGLTGYLAAGHPAPIEGIPPERVIFEIGSITKVFTGLLLAQAVVEHRVALDDPISRYLPPSLAANPLVAAITLEELATHTSGLPRLPGNLHPSDPLDPFADYTEADLDAFLRGFHPSGPPPHPAEYSNVGAGLLGRILALAYKESYGQLLAEKITRPLRLADTAVELNEEQQSRLAVPHVGRGAVRPLRYQEALVGAGGLYSTAADLVRLAHVLMLEFDHPLRAAWELARLPRHDISSLNSQEGLGVEIMARGGPAVYWHGGTSAGTRSHLEWSPADQHILVVLLNSDSLEAMNGVVTLYHLTPPPR